MAERGGFEPPQKPNGNKPLIGAGTLIGTHEREIVPELREIVNQWHSLPEHIRLSVLALVRASKGGAS